MPRNHPLLRIANGLSGGRIDDLSEAVKMYGEIAMTNRSDNELLQERIAELELAVDDQGYEKLGDSGSRQLSKASLDRIADMARVYWLKNPLVKRAVATQANYVLGNGFTVVAEDEGVQDVIDSFLADERNRAELTGDQAMLTKETELQVAANLFFAFFTDPINGATRVCTIPLNEVVRVICNPEDGHEPWYYYRRWEQPKEAGSTKYETRKAMYPDINYKPKGGLPAYFNGVEVMRENPVYHVKVNCLTDMEFGVPEIYAAIDWAKAYKEFLEDWYAIVKSLSKFSWKATSSSGSRGIEDAQRQLAARMNPSDGALPEQSANIWMSTDNFDLSPMPKSGATVSVEDGRRALLMVCAATGIYEHYFGDPSTGNLATATSMEQPMLRMFTERQKLWEDVFETILDYVIDQSALKPGGRLHGTQVFDDYGELHVDLGDTSRTFKVDFPPILDEDANAKIDAIVKMTTLGGSQPADTIDLKTATTQMLTALGEDTAIVDRLFPDDPVSWEEIAAQKQAKAMEIAGAQRRDETEDDEEDEDGEPEDETDEPEVAGEEEESYLRALDRMVKALREQGV